jgi:hypothetical protein
MTSETQPPCASCRHAETCIQPPTCHALGYFRQTGLRITPPRRNPCSQIETQNSPSLPIGALKPCIIERNQGFTNTHLEALMGTRRKRKSEEVSIEKGPR